MRAVEMYIAKSSAVFIIVLHCLLLENAASNIIVYVISVMVSKIEIVASVVDKAVSFVTKFGGGASNVVVDSEFGGRDFSGPVLPQGLPWRSRH